MSILALDISKRSTGWAFWRPGMEKPVYASVTLGSEFTSDGRCCLKFHQVLADLHSVHKFEHCYFEKPLTQLERGGNSNAGNDIQIKLVAHAESFAEAYGLRTIMGINISSWRKFFVGRMPRGTKSKDWKDYARERCEQYGWRPRTTDEADALGLLDYSCDLQGIVPVWRVNEVLRPALAGVA